MLYTYPKDFTFICPTEIVEFDSKLKAFGDRGAVLLAGRRTTSSPIWRGANRTTSSRRSSNFLLFISPSMAQARSVAADR